MSAIPAGSSDAVTPSQATSHARQDAPKSKAVWAKRAGAGVFLFFLIKGLLWLIVPPVLILGARLFAQ